jgi:hypothetical protein
MSGRTTFRPATRGRHCPVCDGDHKCGIGADGSIQCGRVPDSLRPGDQSNGYVFLGRSEKDPQFGVFRAVDDPVLREKEEEWQRERRRRPPPSANGTAHHGENGEGEDADMEKVARDFAENLTPERRTELAQALGLPECCLALLPRLGFSAADVHGPCWTFPQVDASGRTINVLRRYRDGSKLSLPGGHLGLIVPDGWEQREGPVLLVEGPSDTLTLAAMALCAVGRPSNVAGVGHLADLLRDVPAERRIVVGGEYDPGDKGQWPGLEGAKKTAAHLAEKLCRPVDWVLPPRGAKDVRAWALQQQLGVDCLDAWCDAGEELLRRWEKKYQTCEPGAGAPAGFAWKATDLVTLAAAARRPEMLVKRLLVRGQPMIVGAPHKSMKTTVMCDLAVSLATGTKFLNFFEAYRPTKVALFSGESGEWTLMKTFERVCGARGLDLTQTVGRLLVQPDGLPQLSNVEHMDYLRRVLEREQVEVFILDPLYLTLLAGTGRDGAQASNIYEMGPLFQNVTRACLDVGATPILVHHTRRGAAASREPLGLEDLAYAGVAEFAREWLLLSRREPYDGARPGSHRLWMSAGGSAGHGGLWGLDIEEGEADEDLEGRRWEVAVSTAAEEREAAQGEKEREKRDALLRRDVADEDALTAALDRLDPSRQGASYRQVRIESQLPKERMERAHARLRRAKVVEDVTVKVAVGNGAFRDAQGIRRPRDDRND